MTPSANAIPSACTLGWWHTVTTQIVEVQLIQLILSLGCSRMLTDPFLQEFTTSGPPALPGAAPRDGGPAGSGGGLGRALSTVRRKAGACGDELTDLAISAEVDVIGVGGIASGVELVRVGMQAVRRAPSPGLARIWHSYGRSDLASTVSAQISSADRLNERNLLVGGGLVAFGATTGTVAVVEGNPLGALIGIASDFVSFGGTISGLVGTGLCLWRS